MNIHLLTLFLFLPSFFACQQDQEKALANIVLQSSATSHQATEKAEPSAANIILKSVDGGQTWQDVSAGLPKGLGVGRVFADTREVILVSENQLFRSGSSSAAPVWESEMLQDISISNIFPARIGTFASSYRKGFFKEITGTGVWLPMHESLNDKTVRCILETSDGTLFVGCESGVYKSTDGAKTWKLVYAEVGANSLVEAEGVLICGTYEGLLRSIDGGEHWDKVLTEDYGAWNIKRIEGGLVSITEGGHWEDADRSNRLRISTDQGKTWQRMDEGLALVPFMYSLEENLPTTRRIYGIEQAGKYLFCSTNAGIFRSADLGKNWELVRLSSSKEMLNLAVSGNVIYAVQVIGC